MVKNLNDGVAWGIFPLYFASQGLELNRIGALVAVYPLVWGTLQLATGWASDLLGRKPLIVIGMILQGAAISLTVAFDSFSAWIVTMSMLGLGTALVYPTLLAAIADAVPAIDRATALGVYRFWRDAGFIAGALLAGAFADLFGFSVAIQFVAALTVASGVVAKMTVRGKQAVQVDGSGDAGTRGLGVNTTDASPKNKGIVPKQPPVREWWHGTEDWVPSMSTRQELEHSAR